MAALGKSRETPLEFETVREGEIAVVAVSPGPGLARIFANLHVSAIVEGGQTMNPSTQEIISAVEKLPTKKIIVLPNNKNIILTAKSAAVLTDCEVRVIETRSIPVQDGLRRTLGERRRR